MERITKSLFENFIEKEGLLGGTDSKNFEKFVTKIVLTNLYRDTFSYNDVSTGASGDCGIDGIAFVVNDVLIKNIDELEDMFRHINKNEVSIIFLQTKTSSNFDGKDVLNFGHGIIDFLSDSPSMFQNEIVKEKYIMMQFIIKNFSKVKMETFQCLIFYVTTGKWVNDQNLIAVLEKVEKDIKDQELFKRIQIQMLGRDEIRSLVEKNSMSRTTKVKFEHKVPIPIIDGINDSFIGILPIKEYIKMLKDENDLLKKEVFWGNVRDYQGAENPVNSDIHQTLNSNDKDKFGILNNGVTIVAKKLIPCRGEVELIDYQIVNGCQTSNILYEYREDISDEMWVTLKLIVTEDEAIINQIIKSTNNQTKVTKEQLLSLSDFQKKLESFYNTFIDETKLFYERRSGQYHGQDVNTSKIVTIEKQLKAFASMFLNEPHRASRFYGAVLEDIKEKIFNNEHELLPYYTSAYALYKIDYYLNNELIEKKYKKFAYHIVSMFKHMVIKENHPQLNSKKIITYCEKMLEVLYDDDKFLEVLKKITVIIDIVVNEINNTEITKNAALVSKLINAAKTDILSTLKANQHNYVLSNLPYFNYVFFSISVDGDLRFNFKKRLAELKQMLSYSSIGMLYIDDLKQINEAVIEGSRKSRKENAIEVKSIISNLLSSKQA